MLRHSGGEVHWNPDVTFGDTSPMLDTVEKNLFPRIIEGVEGNFTGVQQVWFVADLPTYLGISSNSLAVAPTGKRFSSETGIAMLDPWKAGPTYYSIWSTE